MKRLILCLALFPATATAEWSPLPRGFAYDATFARCTSDIDRVDTGECARFFRDAFVLNRAVTSAVSACESRPLDDCTLPFEDRGLPAIAARIASSSQCDMTPVTAFEAVTPLPQDHCITMISDILRDEGVVPLDAPSADTTCGLDATDCEVLSNIQSTYWYMAVSDLSDSPLTMQRSDLAWTTCRSSSRSEAAAIDCHIAALANIWIDLTQTMAEDT